MTKVVLVSTGGTIASRMDTPRGYVSATAGGDELVNLLHDPLPGIAVEIDEFCNIGSFNIDLVLAFRLVRRIEQHLARPDVAGVAVTHPHDGGERLPRRPGPRQRQANRLHWRPSQCGRARHGRPRNLAGAIPLSASGLRELGAVILFDEDFHAARDATKIHAYRTGAFTSMEHGKLGEIDGERIVLHRRPALRATIPTERIEPGVDLIKLVMGQDARFIRCALQSGARGIVVEGFGRGNATLGVVEACARLSRRKCRLPSCPAVRRDV
jgi:L-asparaginase